MVCADKQVLAESHIPTKIEAAKYTHNIDKGADNIGKWASIGYEVRRKPIQITGVGNQLTTKNDVEYWIEGRLRPLPVSWTHFGFGTNDAPSQASVILTTTFGIDQKWCVTLLFHALLRPHHQMNRHFLSSSLGVASFLAFHTLAHALIVFSNPLNSTLSGYGSNDPPATSGRTLISQQMADDFFFASDATIASVTWFGNYGNDQFGAGFSSKFIIRLFADDGTGSSPVNSAPFFSQNVTAVARGTGVISVDNHNVLSYAANLAFPLSLPAGKYWLSIVEAEPETIEEAWEWASTATGSGATNVRRLPPSTPNWIPVGTDARTNRAFILDDTAQPVSGLPPSLEVDVDSISFGEVVVGQPVTMRFSLENSGYGTVYDLTFSIIGNKKGEYVVTGECAASSHLAGGIWCEGFVTLNPIHPGRKKRTLSIDGTYMDAQGHLHEVNATIALDGKAVWNK